MLKYTRVAIIICQLEAFCAQVFSYNVDTEFKKKKLSIPKLLQRWSVGMNK